MLLSLFSAFWPLLQWPNILLIFRFFLFFLARIYRRQSMNAWGVPEHPSPPHYSPIISVSVMCRPRHPYQPISPPTPLPKLWPVCPSVCLFVLFFVCCVPIHPLTPIRTHPHPPESLIPRLCIGARFVCLPGNFPAIHGPKTSPPNPSVSLLTVFLCFSVSPNPIAPIQTHKHPCTPVHTHPHPILHREYVYLCKYNNINMYIYVIF